MAQRHTPKKANRNAGTGTKLHQAAQPTPAKQVSPSPAETVEKKLKLATAVLNFTAAAIKATAAVRPYAEHLIDVVQHWISNH